MFGVVQRIFQDHYREVNQRRGFSADQRKAARSICDCRTKALGGHMEACPQGHVVRAHYNSCKHRSCPQCAFVETELWIRRQLARLPGCDYHHVIMTIPHTLNVLWRYNRRKFGDLFLSAGWHVLRDTLSDERWLGALPAVLVALQTWDEFLGEHIHLHCLVSAGGVTPSGEWKALPGKYLVYPRVLADLLRGKFIAYLRAALEKGELEVPPGMSVQQCHNLLNRVSQYAGKKWHVEVEPRYERADGVIKYLARYLKGGPISEQRISGYDGRHVRIEPKRRGQFEGRDCPERRREPQVMDGSEFVERLLNHVPPRGMQTVRSYGMLQHGKVEQLNAVRVALGQARYQKPAHGGIGDLCREVFDHDPTRCPVCGRELVVIERLAATRGPPWGAGGEAA